MKKMFIACAFIVATGLQSIAAQKEEVKSDTDILRCEKFTQGSLKELKDKLQENCNLDKPFSSNMSVNLGEVFYMYCCHKK